MKYLYLLTFLSTISACGGTISKADDSYEAWNEEVRKLFVCDQNDPTAPKSIQKPVEKQASVLARIYGVDAKITLKTDQEIKLFASELRKLLSLQEDYLVGYKTSEYLKEELQKERAKNSDQAKIKDLENLLKVSPAREILEALESTNSPYEIEKDKIVDAVNQIASDLRSNRAKGEGHQLFRQLFIGHKIFGKNALFGMYSGMLLKEQLMDDFKTAIESGFFVDDKNAWSILANFSPLYRKNLQRWVEELPASNQAEVANKELLQSVLRSERFAPLANDRHAANLKAHFGNNIFVEGIARGSVAAAYLVSCRNNGADKYFVAKAGVYSKEDLRARLQKEFAFDFFNHEFGISLLALLYPGVSMQGVEFKREKGEVTNHKESAVKIKKNIEQAILDDVDFKHEAKNLYELFKSYKPFSAVKIVRGAFESINGEDYLFMEHAPGKPLSELSQLSQEQAQSLNNTLQGLYEEIVFGAGPYHADAHAGNIIVDGTSITLIDAGRIADLSAEDRKNIQALEFILDYLAKLGKTFKQEDEIKLINALDAQGFTSQTDSMKGPVRSTIISLLWPTSVMQIEAKTKKYRDLVVEGLNHNNYHNLALALRATVAIEDIYQEYVKKYGIGGDYYQVYLKRKTK